MVRKNAKTLICQSLLELLAEYPLAKIDVQDITAHCNLSRQTFYYNFKNKQDLIEWILAENNNKALSYFLNNGTLHDFILHTMLIMQEYKQFYTELTGCSQSMKLFSDYFEQGIVTCAETIEARCAIGKMNGRLWSSLHFFTYGAKGMLADWVDNGMQEEPYQLAEIIIKSMPCRVDRYFQQCF